MAFSYNNYTESDTVKKRREEADAHSKYVASDAVNLAKQEMDKHNANKVSNWTGGTYGESLKQAINKINNREKFTYDLNGDALYQQYKNQYINQGRLAMQDTIGQASALTGGYGNSYAATAGNQAYQGYLQNLNDVIPELYQIALNKYNAEGDDLRNQLGMYQDAYNTEYGEYRDRVSDWNTTADRLTDRYYNEANLDYNRFTSDRDYYADMYKNESDREYGQYTDAYNRAFAQYQQNVAEDQWAKEFALQQAQYEASLAKSSGGSGGSSRRSSSSSTKSSSRDKTYSTGSGEKTASEIANAAIELYNEHPDWKLNDRTLDGWMKDHGYTGAAGTYFKTCCKAAGMKSRIRG